MAQQQSITPEQLEFAIFAIENVAADCGVPGDVAYRALAEDSDILTRYIIPFYDVLHTQGKEYIVRDILDVMNRNGVSL